MALFRRGHLWLYKIDGECDETELSGEQDGPFTVYRAFFQPALGYAHRYATETYVTAFNDQMRLMHRRPERFGKTARPSGKTPEAKSQQPNHRSESDAASKSEGAESETE